MEFKRPDSRLSSAVPFITPDGTVADIGTDHAYLPIFLIQNGLCKKAIACDINKGPIERAKEHIRQAGLSDRIATLQTDGLHGVESFHPDNVLIFGMGGELIAKILSEAPWVQTPDVHLILQPMTKPEVLRRYLNDSGFAISDEVLTHEEQYYQTIHAVWRGTKENYSDLELFAGKKNLNGNSPFLPEILRLKMHVLEDIVAGKEQGKNADCQSEKNLLEAIRKKLEELSHEHS